MTAFDSFAQHLAAFILHAFWQIPLLAGSAWCATRIGRPHVRVAHRIWVTTLALCVMLPLFATVAARRAALRAERDAANATVSFDAMAYAGELPNMQREPAWLRILHRHLSVQNGLQPFAFAVPGRYARVLAAAYLLLVSLFLWQLAVGWWRMRRLVQGSGAAPMPPTWTALLNRQCVLLGLRPPPLRCSGGLAGPALAGVIRPVLLLPTDALPGLQDDEFDAILLHELAHLARRDPVLHAACSVMALPVAFHPVAWWVARGVRQTREMACDADAAERMGSHAVYARSLLQVAERIGGQRMQRSVLGFFSNGLFGADLGLFNGSGAMEERMRKLTEVRQQQTRGARALRVAAGVSLAGAAMLVAGMLQVRPALAGERVAPQPPARVSNPVPDQAEGDTPRLLSGDHAREQLRQARRDLAKAEQQATTDEDRRKISTARDIAAAAESALAQAGSSGGNSNPQVDLSGLDVRLSDLKLPNIDASVSHLTSQQEAYLQSPEWKAKLEKQRAYFHSPEWRATIEKQRAYFNSPEWKASIEKQQAQFNSPEWKANIAAIMRDARQQAERAREQMRSGVFQRQVEQANSLMARNEPPVPIASSEAEGPVKVSPAVMSGSATHKEQPIYPPEAKEKKIQGAVLLHAIISEDGKVERLSVVSSPDELLSKSAIEAVQKWTYKPYLLNGKATAVDTTITVNYSFGE